MNSKFLGRDIVHKSSVVDSQFDTNIIQKIFIARINTTKNFNCL